MTALDKDQLFEVMPGTELFRRQRRIPVTAGITYYRGGAIAIDSANKAVKVTATPGLKIVGYYNDFEFTAVDGQYIEVYSGKIARLNSGGDPVTLADLEQIVYAEDDQTVAKTSAGGTLSALGILVGFEEYTNRPIVMIGMGLERLFGTTSQIQWRTLTATHTTITAAAADETLSIGAQIPAGSLIVAGSIVLTTPFSGGTVADFAVDVGSAGDPDALIDGADLFAAAVDGMASSAPAGIAPNKYFAGATQLQAKFMCASDDVGDATAGSCTIRIGFITI